MKIIAKNGSSYLIEAKKDIYWKFDVEEGITYKNVSLQGQLSRGYWEENDGGILAKDILKKAKEVKEIIL